MVFPTDNGPKKQGLNFLTHNDSNVLCDSILAIKQRNYVHIHHAKTSIFAIKPNIKVLLISLKGTILSILLDYCENETHPIWWHVVVVQIHLT